MKLSLFAHAERYSDESYERLYADLVDLVRLAEDGGFHSFWVGEHYGMDFTAAPNPLVLLSHLAARTSRIRLVTGNIIAPFWHPVRLASEAALADVLSGGRLELGVARGAYQFEFDRIVPELQASEGGAALREMVPLLRKLWAGDAAHDGLWSFPETTSIPKPTSAGGPPIWIAAREAASHDFAVANGCNVCCTPLAKGDEEVEDLVAKFEQAVADHPEVPRPKLMMLRHACVVDGEDEVDDAARAVRGWYGVFERMIRNDGSARLGQVPPLDEAELESKERYSLEAIKRSALVGTPETVIERLRRYEALGIDEVGFWTDFPGGQARKRRSIELLAEHAVPVFSGTAVATHAA
ncbi:MAG TPA: LLM class flavin-dependent oxidoreductase [Solirubrobacteraceae bacterium]|nr:LLM class flavin-dependent oxidoreductase [Solirubrobacteraceae bacterium]